MWPSFVYLHRRADDGVAFYVGKGRAHKRQPLRRAYATTKRNVIWQRTVAKHGLTVEIVAHFLTDADAQTFEKEQIALYGRLDLGRGPLVNLTDGGDGHCGLIVPERVRRIRSALASRPRSPAWVASMRAARKNGGNGGVVKRGDKLPEWWRERIARAVTGDRNHMHGRCGELHPNVKRVVDGTGRVYPSVTAAAKELGMRMQTLHNMLTGFRPNSTEMRFA